VELSLELVDSPLARRMVLSVGGGPGRFQLAEALADALRSHPEVAWVETRVDEDALSNLYPVYFDRRVYFASERPALEVPAMFTPRALARKANELKRQLAQPMADLVKRTAPADPLGFFERILDRIRGTQPVLSHAGEGFASADGKYAIALIGLRSSPFDSLRQAALLDAIETHFARLNAAGGGDLELELSGVNRIAIATERSIRSDVDWMSLLSIAGVGTLFLLVFRSIRSLLIAILTPLFGFAVALAAALSLSPPVHGITIGFGVVLVGVAIDYPIHLINHHAFSRAGASSGETLQRIRASLILSGLTTTVGFATLALSDFPGLRQMGSFGAVGVPAALAMVVLFVPAFLRPSAPPSRAQLALSDAFVRLVGWLQGGRRPIAAFATFASFGLVAALGIPQLRWEDDPATLMAADPELLAESDRVRRRIVDVDGARFVVALGRDRESALMRNDRVAERLAGAVAAGSLEGFRSLHALLWSQALQLESWQALRSVPQLAARVDRSFSAAGFEPGAFSDFAAAVERPAAPPLVPEDLADSPLARALDALAELNGRWAVVTYLRGVRSGEGVRSAVADLEGVHYVDQKQIISSVYGGYRRSALRMLALGSVLMFAVLQLRYRSLKRGLLAFLPSLLVALTTLGVFGLLAIPVNVVSVVSLVVVLGMGVDYGIFTVDGAIDTASDDDRRVLGATLSSLFVSCLTTVFVFGTLALSGQPALRAIGLTTGIGILLALVLSPSVFVLARREWLPARGSSDRLS
jgi:predicted exporter